MSIGQEMLKRIADGSITPAVLEQIANMPEDKLATVLEKETFRQERENLGLSEFGATIEEIYQLEGFDGLFSKIKKGFKKIAKKIKKEAKRVVKKVGKELKRPGVWKAVGAVANFIPGVGPILGTAITAAARTIGTMREAKMQQKEAEKAEAAYQAEEAAYYASLAQQPPQDIVYDQPSAAQVQSTVSSVTQLATPYTVQALKAQQVPTGTQAQQYQTSTTQAGGTNLMKFAPLAAIPLVMMLMKG